MLTKIRKRLSWRSERGDAELVSMILMLPISVFLLLSLIDLSVYFNVRAQIQQSALNGARLTALYGGNPRGLSTNNSGSSVSNTVLAGIYSGGKCTISSGCPSGYVPNVDCGIVTSGNSIDETHGAERAGQNARCVITYKFQPVVQGDIFGFVGITTGQFKVQGNYYTETGFGS